MKANLLILISVSSLSACSGVLENVRPIIEYQHLSHATQHGRGIASDDKRALDLYSIGASWQPYNSRLRVELLEGITMYSIGTRDHHEETFSGRITLELGPSRKTSGAD